ncbi:hypothetical protein CA11_02510 [Gimesia maris]|uniref:hypothetical protein n=1 Tax=Gimesia maris TaxID=122 RepID=UPI0011877E5F|nr:hypothetical protein [Gimesia maris]QDU12472.1 hypothetical protein CA11_02510 [Gimesia maris]
MNVVKSLNIFQWLFGILLLFPISGCGGSVDPPPDKEVQVDVEASEDLALPPN